MRLRSLLLFAFLAGCGTPKAKPPPPSFDGPAQPGVSTASERERVSITVYSNGAYGSGFGLVREVRKTVFPAGKVSLEWRDVAAHIQPETVHIKALGADQGLFVFEQNYRYDLLSPAKLLEKYVGKKVRLLRWNEKLGTDESFEAEVLSVEGGVPVFKIGSEITSGFPGRISFPEVPANLVAKPTLVWLLGSSQPKPRVEVTYLTRQIGWKADYVLALDANDQLVDLTGWVTLDNKSGTSYENAELKLVAGDVNRVRQEFDDEDGEPETANGEKDKKEDSGFKEEGLFEYHLYTLGRPTTVRDNEQKQVTLLSANGVGVEKKLIFPGQSYWYRGNYGQVVSNQKIAVFLDIQNTEKNKLGVPLPKGIVRVYKADASGARQFVGEDAIDHTPRDEKIRVKMGDAFDVVGDRKEMSWTPLYGGCGSESTWEISLRNHRDSAVAVEVFEPVGGDWEIVSSSLKANRRDAHTFTFDAKVPAKGETKITYRVRVKWC
ncbi:MAG: DUF4139 domain-containing protein [Polyangiales bacterium]